MKQRKQKKKSEPYKQIKKDFIYVQDPFRDVPEEERLRILREISSEAKKKFDESFPRLKDWFLDFDAVYLLSLCACRYLTGERGIDKEATEGKLDFSYHHLELMQAISLMHPRSTLSKPIQNEIEELQKYLKDLIDALAYSQYDFPFGLSESELQKRSVIFEMRFQTLALRGWASQDQTIKHLKGLFSGQLSKVISREYGGLNIVKLIDSIVSLTELGNERINSYFHKLLPVWNSKTFDEAYSAYCAAFTEVEDQRELMREVFEERFNSNLDILKSFYLTHSELFLPDIFTFSLEKILKIYGGDEHEIGIRKLFDDCSYRFGDLADENPKHFIFTNPIHLKPFIKIENDSYFWPAFGTFNHTLPMMLEKIIPLKDQETYSLQRSKYLEDQVEELCKKSFAYGQVFRGSFWKMTPGSPAQYENDILVLIDSTALIIECKSSQVDPSARRGGEERLITTLREIIVEGSIQATRFVQYLQSNPGIHEFKNRVGGLNKVDVSKVLRFIPFTVTYENLGFVSANLKKCIKGGLIPNDTKIVPSYCLTDLEVILEILDSQSERIHYLSRRSEIEQNAEYVGDESDLFAFYLKNGFNLPGWEEGEIAFQLGTMSQELNYYFMAKSDQVQVPKPQ